MPATGTGTGMTSPLEGPPRMRVAVIGAGFSGLISTLAMLRAGARVDLYEEHRRVGYPPHCTGLVSEWVVDMIGRPARSSILAWYPGLELRVKGKATWIEPKGGVYKLDRVRLEEEMLGEAESQGARILLGARVSRATPDGTVHTPGDQERYDLVLLADGAHGALHGMLGIGHTPKKVTGLNAHYTTGPSPQGIIVDFTPSLHNDLFAWILRVQDTVLAGTGGPPASAKRLLERVERTYGLEGRNTIYGGPVLLGPPAPRPWRGKVVVIGDAAGLTKPLTGGGLYPSTQAATHATRLVDNGAPPVEAWRRSVARVVAILRRQYRVAEALRRDPRLLEETVAALESSGLARGLAGKIDYDRHDRLPLEVVSRPLKGARFLARLAYRHPWGLLRALARVLAPGWA